jgi:hypothetical protein
MGMRSKTGPHRFHRKPQKSVKLVEIRSKFKFQTFGQLKSVLTGKPVIITDKPVGLSVSKSINWYKLKFLKNPLKIGENSKRSSQESLSNLHHLVG